jgi:prolyl-tRNA synthetase
MQAESGPIGGDMSHEFVILADTGESEVACHKDFIDMDLNKWDLDPDGDLNAVVDEMTKNYAATDERRDPEIEKTLGQDLVIARGIEVGHIFYFGKKYSAAMGAIVTGPDGEDVTVEMGSYGIGVSRLVGGIIEASHDDNGIIWPQSVAPFKAGLINLKPGDSACDGAADDLYQKLIDAGVDVLMDDREGRAGVKFADMDLIGLPWQVVVGPKGLKDGIVEVKNRATGERQEVIPEDAVKKLVG